MSLNSNNSYLLIYGHHNHISIKEEDENVVSEKENRTGFKCGDNVFDFTSNRTMANLIRQMSSFMQHAEDIFSKTETHYSIQVIWNHGLPTMGKPTNLLYN